MCGGNACRSGSACRRILDALDNTGFTEFSRLFDPREGRSGLSVTFLAILELIKEATVEVVQNELYGPIYLRASAGVPDPDRAGAGERRA